MKTVRRLRQAAAPAFVAAAAFAAVMLPLPPGRAAAPAAPTPARQRGRQAAYRIPTGAVRPYQGSDARRYTIVYLPPGYDDPANARRRYPVIYLLHGSPGNPINFVQYGRWTEAMDNMIAGGTPPALLVIPDGNSLTGPKGDSEWANWTNGKERFEDFVTRDVVGWTDARFRTQANPAGRIIGGVSEGGYGSVNLALRHPDVFGAALACSGYYQISPTGWEHQAFGDDENLWKLNSPLWYVDNETRANGRRLAAWRRLRFYLGAGANEKRYADETRQMAARLRAAGVPSVTLELLPGKHGWDVWHALFQNGVRTLLGSGAGRNGATT